jgi:tRNA A-37 threonylcarbamoyl transferase component Bud32
MSAVEFSDLSGREPPCPWEVELDGDLLRVEEWLRILPDRRYVGRGTWQSRPVLAKLFTGSGARRKLESELQGYRLLENTAIPSPPLLSFGGEKQATWVLYEFLQDSGALSDIWAESRPNDRESETGLLRPAVELIAEMHKQGILQRDLHLDNFISQQDKLWLVDVGELSGGERQPLPAEQAADNLGLFFAQGEAAMPVADLLVDYNAVADQKLDLATVRERVGYWRLWRAKDLMAKSVRDCTLFKVDKSSGSFVSVRRDEADALGEVVENPDAFLANGKPLKQGGSATVSLVEYDGRPLVIKRYNIKNWRHALSRCWRPSRAWHSWQIANALRALGIATPAPLAMREKRWGGLRRQAWLISSYAPGQDIIRHTQQGLDPKLEQALIRLLSAMKEARLSHGDMKGSNLLYENGSLAIIDLDAARLHRRQSDFVSAFNRDRSRLLRNWLEGSTIRQRLDEVLPRAD